MKAREADNPARGCTPVNSAYPHSPRHEVERPPDSERLCADGKKNATPEEEVGLSGECFSAPGDENTRLTSRSSFGRRSRKCHWPIYLTSAASPATMRRWPCWQVIQDSRPRRRRAGTPGVLPASGDCKPGDGADSRYNLSVKFASMVRSCRCKPRLIGGILT